MTSPPRCSNRRSTRRRRIVTDRPTPDPGAGRMLRACAAHGPMPFSDIWKHAYRFSWRTGRIVERAGLIRTWYEGRVPIASADARRHPGRPPLARGARPCRMTRRRGGGEEHDNDGEAESLAVFEAAETNRTSGRIASPAPVGSVNFGSGQYSAKEGCPGRWQWVYDEEANAWINQMQSRRRELFWRCEPEF